MRRVRTHGSQHFVRQREIYIALGSIVLGLLAVGVPLMLAIAWHLRTLGL